MSDLGLVLFRKPFFVIDFYDDNLQLTNIDSDTLVSDIKFLIYCFNKIPQHKQRIYHCTELMTDANTLAYYGIFGNTRLKIKICDT